MAPKNVILTLLALTSLAYGQTRALFVNTNGTVQWGTTLRFDGPLDFTTNGFAATTRSNLSLGLPALTNTSNAGMLSALGGLTTNGDAAGLTNFPASLLRTNGDAAGLTNFPASLLRTNGDGSGLTNLPNADLGSATGVLPLANGGTGATNASAARTALELGTAATNDATAFQPANTNLTALAGGDGSSLTNVTITDASTLTNFPAELLRTNGDAAGLTNFPASVLLTNGDAAGLTNFPAELLRTNGDASGLIGVATYPAFSNNAGKVLAVATNEAGVEWLPVSNTVTDASLLTNFPASLLTTNGDASGLTNFPTLNQNTTGTANNVTGVVAIANGGSGQTTAEAAIEAFLPAYSGNADRILALNSNATGLVWTTNSGGGGGLPETPLAISNGGTGATNGGDAIQNLGLVTYSSSTRSGVKLGFAANPGDNNSDANVVIGHAASVGNNGGNNGNGAVVIGLYATNTGAGAGGVAIGNTAQSGNAGIAIGYNTLTANGYAIGSSAITTNSPNAISIGTSARNSGATNSVQLSTGTNTNANTIQFLSAGSVDTNEWARIAALSTYPTTNISVVGTNNTNTLVFSNGILVEVQ